MVKCTMDLNSEHSRKLQFANSGFFFLKHTERRVIFIENKAQEAQVQQKQQKRDPTDLKKEKGEERKTKTKCQYTRVESKTKSRRVARDDT